MGLIDAFGNTVKGAGQVFDEASLNGIGLNVSELLTNLGAIQKHCDEQKKVNDNNVAALEQQKTNDSTGMVMFGALTGALSLASLNSLTDKMSGGSLTEKTSVALDGLVKQGVAAKDNILKGISDIHPSELVAKAYADFDPNKSANEAYNTVKNMLSMTIQQIGEDALIIPISQIAINIITELKKRDAILDRLEKNVAVLYNQLFTVINGKDLVGPYLVTLRQAYGIIVAEEIRIRSVRNTLARSGVLNNRTFDLSVKNLEIAQKLIMPNPSTTKKYTFAEDAANSIFPSPLKDVLKAPEVAKSLDASITSLVGNVTASLGALSIEPSMQAFIGMGNTMVSLAQDASSFSKSTITINSLLVQYYAAAGQFAGLTNLKGFNQGLIDQMDAVLTSLNVLSKDMGTTLGNAPTETYLRKNRSVVLRSSDWHVQLASILAHLKFIYRSPAPPAENTNTLKSYYEISVATLKSYNNRTLGFATLTATQSKEEFFGLSKAVIKTVGISTRALKDLNVDKNAETYFKSVRDRIKLSRSLGVDMVKALTPVASAGKVAPEPTPKTPPVQAIFGSIPSLANLKIPNMSNGLIASSSLLAIGNIKDIFGKFGFDRGLDLLNLGQFTSLYQSTLANATYAGQAINAASALINSLKACPSVGQEEIKQLEDVKNKFKDDEHKKQLNSRRVASNNILAREKELQQKGVEIEAQCQRATSVVDKCVPGSSKSPDFSQLLSQATGGIFNIKL